MIAAAIMALGLASSVSAQKDAAEKEKEGGIEHWIEYYKGEQRKPAATTTQESATSSVHRAVPVERTEPGASPQEKTAGK